MSSPYITEFGVPVFEFNMLPGIQSDGTKTHSKSCIDGQNTRFYQGLPKKIGGYKLMLPGTSDIVRKEYAVPIEDYTRIFLFRNSGISSYEILSDGTNTPETDRTPVGWISVTPGTPDYTFSVDTITVIDIVGSVVNKYTYMFAVGIPNAENINQSTEYPVFYMDVENDSRFKPLGQSTSGGLVVVEPYLILYGNNGIMRYSQNSGGISDPLVFPIENILGVSAGKLLAAKVFRNSIYYWTSDNKLKQVIIDFSTDPISFTVLTAAPDISLLSPDSIITGNNNTYYWVGTNQFFQFNGTVTELKNTFNKRTFFEQLNTNVPGKVWGIYNGEYNELWWFAPNNGNNECTTAYVNCRDEPVGNMEFSWFKTEKTRSCGIISNVLKKPIYASSTKDSYLYGNTYPIWQEEFGVDREENGQSFPIDSYFTTRKLFSSEVFGATNLSMRLFKIEQDFVQNESMSVTPITYGYVNSPGTSLSPISFNPNTTHIDLDISGRWIALKYTSNILGGDYFMGKHYLHIKPSGVRPETN